VDKKSRLIYNFSNISEFRLHTHDTVKLKNCKSKDSTLLTNFSDSFIPWLGKAISRLLLTILDSFRQFFVNDANYYTNFSSSLSCIFIMEIGG
jgi:hypothetical protein